MPKKIKTDWTWPAWFYGPDGEDGIFQNIQEVPYGWRRVKPKEFVPMPPPEPIDEGNLRQALVDKNIDINPIWGVAHMQKVLVGND